MESAYIELKDISQEVSAQGESIEFNPTRLDEVNDRLNLDLLPATEASGTDT